MNNGHSLRDVAERFYVAVQAVLKGDAAPMLQMWAQSDAASYCDTRGEIVMGWQALEAYWRQAAAANLAAPIKITGTGQIQHVVVTGDLAYVVALEEVRRGGESSVMKARATNIYRRDASGDGTWRLLHRHADAAPKVSEQEPA
jgi:ketosteroid isomerase-like protein